MLQSSIKMDCCVRARNGKECYCGVINSTKKFHEEAQLHLRESKNYQILKSCISRIDSKNKSYPIIYQAMRAIESSHHGRDVKNNDDAIMEGFIVAMLNGLENSQNQLIDLIMNGPQPIIIQELKTN